MTEDPRNKGGATGRPPSGVLPDGVRGTTRDIGATIPQDEHAGHGQQPRPLSETDRETAADPSVRDAVPPSPPGNSTAG